MIIGLVTLFALIFGGGSVDVFYIDKIEKGVKKYVTDKDRKAELNGYLKEYQTTYKAWNKEAKTDLKEFKLRNLDREGSIEWYESFFESRKIQRVELQKKYIGYRLKLQEGITDDEWTQIMAMSAGADQKQKDADAKQARKNADKDMLKKLRETTDENVTDPEARKAVTAAWDVFHKEYNDIGDAFDNLDVQNSEALANKYATQEDLAAVSVILNEIRAEALEAYIPMLVIVKENTTDEGYEAIMKEFNKHLK